MAPLASDVTGLPFLPERPTMIDRIRDVETEMNSVTDQVREKALDMAATARERAGAGAELVRQFTVQKPAQALGLALGMGVLLGWLIKRR
jgi:ElaB/YqjD/DUF883 family membrane-anchored ribosome-binding protein